MRQTISRLGRVLIVPALGSILTLTASAQSATTVITETPGNYSRATTITGPNGKTATSSTAASYGPGATSRETTVTGFDGRTSSYENNRSWGGGTYSDTRSYTGVNGGVRTNTVTRTGDLVTNTVTGRNGNSRTFTRVARYRR